MSHGLWVPLHPLLCSSAIFLLSSPQPSFSFSLSLFSLTVLPRPQWRPPHHEDGCLQSLALAKGAAPPPHFPSCQPSQPVDLRVSHPKGGCPSLWPERLPVGAAAPHPENKPHPRSLERPSILLQMDQGWSDLGLCIPTPLLPPACDH